MTQSNLRLGIILMMVTTFVFSMQDAISRHLGDAYPVMMIVMIRFWAFMGFAVFLASRETGGIRATLRSKAPFTQILRGVLLAGEICVMIVAFTTLGLVETHAVFASTPLIIAALSGVVLGESVGWRRWSAIGFGFLGILVILQPGQGVFSIYSLIPFLAAVMFALYSLLTRYVSRYDSTSTSFLWVGIVGCIMMTAIGITSWQNMSPGDWGWMALLCVSGAFAHWLLIKCYQVAEASAVQPFAYLQLVFISVLGITLFGETLRQNVVIGTVIVVLAGIFTLWRERVVSKRAG